MKINPTLVSFLTTALILHPIPASQTKPRFGLVIQIWKDNLALEEYIRSSDLFFGVLVGFGVKKESGLEDYSHIGLIPDHSTHSPPNPGFEKKPRFGLVIQIWKDNLALADYIRSSDLFFGVPDGLV